LFGGLALMVAFGLISGAVLRPVVMQTFWVVAAIGLAGRVPSEEANRAHILLRTLPAEIMLVAVIAYFVMLVHPSVTTAQLVADAHRLAGKYVTDRIHYDAEVAGKTAGEKKRRARAPGLPENLTRPPPAPAARLHPRRTAP